MDDLLVLSFVNETRLLRFGEEEDSIEEIDSLPGFIQDRATLGAYFAAGVALQVTKDGVFTSNGAQWTAEGKSVTVAAHLQDALALGLSGGELAVLRITADGQFQLQGSASLPQEIACLTLFADGQGQTQIAAGLWSTQAIYIYALSDLSSPLSSVTVPSSYLLRSVVVCPFSDGNRTLFVGLGDGSLTSYTLDEASTIREDTRKAVTLGTRPVTLDLFDTDQGPAVFVSSDTPTIISRSNARFTFASVNLRSISAFTTFRSAAFGQALVLAAPDSLRIGRIEGSQRMHIRTILLGADQPRRIAWSANLKAYGLLCIREEIDKSTGTELRSSSFKIVNESFDILFDYALEDEEQGMAVSVIQLGSPPTDHFVIGCSTTLPNEKQSKRGRIVAFSFNEEGTFKEVGSADAKGAPYALAQASEGRLAATINAEVRHFVSLENLN